MWTIEVFIQTTSYDVATFTALFATEAAATAYQAMMLADGHATIKTRY
jgi:hypothetical protein